VVDDEYEVGRQWRRDGEERRRHWMIDDALIVLDRKTSQHAAGPSMHVQNQPTSPGAHLHGPEIPPLGV
jgi:hypothetical protein